MAKTGTLAFLTLALLLVPGGSFYLYISEQESYFIDRNFRLLALWSNRLSKTVDEYKYHFQYRISTSLETGDESVEGGKTNSETTCCPVQCPANVCPENVDKGCDYPKDSYEKFKCKFKKEFENFNKHREGLLTLVSISQKTKKLESNNLVTDQPRITAQLSPNDKDFLRLTYYEIRTTPQQACKGTVCEATIEVDLSISKVISPLITEKIFSDVIVFDSETGKVHFQKNLSLYKIDNFRDIVVHRPDTQGFFSFFSDNSETVAVLNGKRVSSTPPLKELLQNPTHRQTTIGDISYELFTQPVVLPQLTPKKQTHYRQTKNGPPRLILAGLVKTEKFQNEYRAIPHTWLLGFLFFVLLGLLSLPIIHLGFMDHREPLRPITVFSLLVTCVFGTALITLLFLDVVWLNNVRTSLDGQLEKTAKNIKEVFEDELEKTVRQLVAYDRSSPFRDDFNCVTQTGTSDVSVCAPDDTRESGGEQSKRWVARKEYPYPCDKKHKEKFPYHCPYDLVFWVDSNKHFRITWTTKSKYHLQTSNASLAHRDYVNRILDLDPESSLWHTKDGHRVYAQPLHSLETGKHRVIFSMASSRNEEDPEGKPQKWVAATRTKFQFLKSMAMPDGTGFAVIEDDGGKVLFHSDDNRSLWENFFEETDDNAQLKAHIFSRIAGEFQGTYWGEGHSFYSIPLPDVPWSLVVFRNKELFRTTNFEALLLASALFALYAVISIILLVILLAAIWLFNKARRLKMSMSWFWPDPDRYDCYSIYVGLNLFFFLTGITWFWFSNPLDDHAVWVALLHLLFSLTLFLIVLFVLWGSPKVSPKRRQGIFPEQLHRRYACMIVSFLLLFSALPMGIFFKIGADREMTLAMKYNLITLGQKFLRTSDIDFSQIQREINDEPKFTAQCPEEFSLESECELVKGEQVNSQQEGGPLQCPEKFVSLKNRTLLQHSIHLNVIAETELCVSKNGPSATSRSHTELSFLERIHRRIRENSLSRLSNPVSISTLGLIGNQSPGNPFHWRFSPSSPVSLEFQVPLKQSDSETKRVMLRSLLPSGWSMSDFSAKGYFWGAIALIVFVPLLLVVPIFIVSRIFPILREPPIKENSNQKTGNFLIIGLPESLESYRQENLPPDQWEGIDCLQIGDWLGWWGLKRNGFPIQKDGVVLQHFEYQFGVPTFDRSKLNLLADLLAEGKQICVLSTINPLKLDHEDDPGPFSPDESKRPASVSLRQWSQVFQSFTLHYHKLDKPETPPESESLCAEPSYEAIWQARTPDEKITLYHLARDGFVHVENPDLRHLFALGLIKPKPATRWFEEGFENYVLDAAQRDRLDAIQHVKRQSRWHVWKWPLAIVFVVLVMGLLLTQQEFKNVVVLMLSLLPVLVPTLSELIEGLQKDGNAT